MARVYANVNAALGPAWYDYGESSIAVDMMISQYVYLNRESEDRLERPRSL